MELDRRKETICPSCGLVKAKSQFHSNPVMNGHKYLIICKTCVNEKLKEYKKLLENDGAALWCLCMELGIPFIRSVWKDTYNTYIEKKESASNNNLFLIYMDYFLTLDKMPTGIWDTDMMLSDFFSDSHIDRTDLINERISIWGKFTTEDGSLDEDAYDYLESTFADYTKDLLDMDANLTRRYRDLAKAELRKRKADESGDMNEIKNAQSVLNNQLTLLKLNNFRDNKQSDTEKFIERMAWNIENIKPSECEDTEIYKDYSHFGVKWEDILRTIKNLVSGTRDYPDIPKGET